MRKSTILVIGLLAVSLFLAPGSSFQGDPSAFDIWRPDNNGVQCHKVGLPNIRVPGSVIFSSPVISVAPDESFSLVAKVSDFGGLISSSNVLLGYNILDADNAEFMDATIAEVHTLDGNGNSATPFSNEFVAPSEPGTYTIMSYAISGTANYFNWVTGSVKIVVTNGFISSGYVSGVIDHLAAVAEPALGGLRWPEDNYTGIGKYKPGMIKGAASIGNFMLDVYEERTRSSLFFGTNNEEVLLPLNLAIGAGDWIVAVASNVTNSEFYWYRSYNSSNLNDTTQIHLPYYEGVAGIASYLGRLYRITHDPDYLLYGKGALTYLMNAANTSNSWYAWTEDYGQNQTTKLSTRWSKGSTGIGSVFLEYYRLTGDITYLNVAKGLFKWLDDSKSLETNNAYWPLEPHGSSGVYLGRWHGVAGIVSFLIDLYQVTGNPAHKALALSGLDYVVANKNDDGSGGIRWENAVGTQEYLSGWSRGGAGVGSVLIRAHELDSSKGYLGLVPAIYKHYENTAITAGDGWAFEDMVNVDNPTFSLDRLMTSIGHGGAGIGMFFLMAYQSTGDIMYREGAMKLGLGLLSQSFIDENGIAWFTSDKVKTIDYYVYYGITGVATFFLEYEVNGKPEFRDLAISTNNYLMSVVNATNNGLRWQYDNTHEVYRAGVLRGAAGDALQLMNMYQKGSTQVLFGGLTPNSTHMYLNYAKMAMKWLEDVAVPSFGGLSWFYEYNATNQNVSSIMYNGYYKGAPGIGDVFTKLSQYTGNQHYMDIAFEVADYLINTANTTTGYAWGETNGSTALSTRWSFGTPGVGVFFLKLYQQSRNTTYLNVAEGVATWLNSEAIADGAGLRWYLIATDTGSGTYLGRWHGVAGIANYYLDLYALTGNIAHLNQATKALNYVLANANIVGDMANFENAVGLGSYISGWSRGPGGIGSTLLRAFLHTDNSTYMDYIKMIVNWYAGNSITTTGWGWADSNLNSRIATSMGHGSAGVLMFATELFYFTAMPEAFTLMYMITEYLKSVVVVNGDKTHWIGSSTSSDINTGMYWGVAGIAYALTKASRFDNFKPMLNVTAGPNVNNESISFSLDIWEDIGIDTIEMSINSGTYAEVNLTNGAYTLNISNYSAGTYVVQFRITDVGGLTAVDSASFTFVEEPTTTISPTTSITPITSTTTTTPKTTEPSSETDTGDGGFLPISVNVVLFTLLSIGIVSVYRRRRS